jgi:dipeptidyl aminopeptidase/acylaminoacyl peptidase
MKRKAFLLSTIGLMIISLLIAIPLLASRDRWTYLGPEDYQLVAVGDGTPVVFNALQDRDKEKIRKTESGVMMENGVEIMDKEPKQIKKRWEDDRPDIVPPLEFKRITPQNTIADVRKEVFEVSYKLEGEGTKVWVWDDKRQTHVLSHVEGETQSRKIAKLFLDGKTIVVPVNPEESSLLLTPDKTKFWRFTDRGFWLVDVSGKATKLSKAEFNGKTYDELREELRKRLDLAGIEGPASVWWNDNPIFSPDGSKIVYMTNRDCIESGGSSLWLYDQASGEEQPLIKNVNAEHYRALTWFDNSHILYAAYYAKGEDGFYIADVTGNRGKLSLEGKEPHILGTYPGTLLVYTPDQSTSREICLVKVDLASKSIQKIYEKAIDGTLREPYSLSPDGSKLAFMYAPDYDDTVQNLAVVDLESKKEIIAKEAPSKEGARTILYDCNWLDDKRLLVRVTRVVNGTNEISSWIYSVEGVK